MSSTNGKNNDPDNFSRTPRDDLLVPITRDKIEPVVEAVKRALSDPELRKLGQRAVQAKIWHRRPEVSAVLQELRSAEEGVRARILRSASELVYAFHEHAVEATLDRAGLVENEDEHPFEAFCLDAKERLYVILKEYDWLRDFFRRYPLHFYENSFQFVDRIPPKHLPVTCTVIGLGIGGSMAVSGLAKRGIPVKGYEKRGETGPGSVSSRYQNASWRAYDTAEGLVDEKAFELLVQNRQRVAVPQQDGTTKVVSSDRVQIILGAAIQAAVESARRYGADLKFDCTPEDYMDNDEPCDVTALFCGAHTMTAFPGLSDELGLLEWKDLDSNCNMWLRCQSSDKTEAFCQRGGEIGCENWHYTIDSARIDIRDLERVRWNQESQYEHRMRRLDAGAETVNGMTKEEVTGLYESQKANLEKVLESVREQQVKDKTAQGSRFDYIFTNAPANEHNLAKRNAVKDSVVLDGQYTVEIKMAQEATVTAKDSDLLKKLRTDMIVCGGDACVPPNPLAAYGATLACEAAGSLVLLVTAIGHVNAILQELEGSMKDHATDEWVRQVKDLKELLQLHYEARARSENYFQFVQTLICNLYSLPAFY